MTNPADNGGQAAARVPRNEAPAQYRGLANDPGGNRTLPSAVVMFFLASALIPVLTLAGWLVHRNDGPPVDRYQQTQTYKTP